MLTRLYQTTGILGRDRGFKLGAGVDSASDLQQTFSFSNDGRFDTLTSERAGDSGTDRTFDYGYFSNSSLPGSLDSGSFHVTWDYEANRDLLKSINTAWTGQNQPVTRYDYTHNALNQRIAAVQSGAAFADYGEATFRRFRYNPRGELVQGFDYLGGNMADISRPLPGRHYEYGYDGGGNRATANRTDVTGLIEHYSTNSLDQYTSKENTTLAVSGTAAPGAAVAVAIGSGSAPADRQGAYWSRDMAVGNAGHPWSGMMTAYAALDGSVGKDNRPAQLPALSQTLSYDLDGNLSSDGMWDYGYDAENRLVSMETTLAARSAGIAWRVLRFSYDYAGRRVQKIVLHGADLSFDSGHRYVYDGWNLIAEYDTTGASLGALRRSYTWGIGFAGAGGAGALLQIADHTANKTYLPTYDGNGNVAALVRADGDDAGTVAAAYEYSPFGESLRADVLDATVADQPFRFSTQFTDIETGLIYYGMRYYSPALGRFINRDPIGEAGGLNLYGFCGNDGVNHSDYLGMAGFSTETPDSFKSYYGSGADRNDSIDDGGVFDGFAFGFVASLPAIDVDDTSWVPANYSVPDAYVEATSGVSRFPTDQPQTKAGAKDVAANNEEVIFAPQRLPHRHTCMECHGLPPDVRAAIGLPQEQPWFNAEGYILGQIWPLLLINDAIDAVLHSIGMSDGDIEALSYTLMQIGAERTALRNLAMEAQGAARSAQIAGIEAQTARRVARALTTRLGVVRNNAGDWRALRDLWDRLGYGGILSAENRALIARGRTPIVDDTWIKMFPEDAGLRGEQIRMHHIGGTPITTPLPETRHIDSHMPGGTRYNPGGPGGQVPIYPAETPSG